MIRVSKKLKRRLAGIVAILVLYAVFFKEIVLFCGCVASCLFLGFYDWRVSHEEIMEGDYVKGEIKVWKSGDEVMVTNACELGSEITQWKYCKHATCYKVADIFVPKFGLQMGKLMIHINENMVFYIYRDCHGVHNYGRYLDESDRRLKKCLDGQNLSIP